MGYANSVGEKEILPTSAKTLNEGEFGIFFSKYWLLVITRDVFRDDKKLEWLYFWAFE